MAGNIKGIIVEIGGDTSGLQNALKKVNSSTSSLSKELKGINSLLKLDPKNTELVAQKQEVLKGNIEETSKKLQELQKVQTLADETMISGGKISQENYRNLQREIIKTENQLNQLKAEASKWTIAGRSIEEFGNKISNISEKIDKMGTTLTTRLTLPIAGIATAMVNASREFETAFTGVEKTVDGTATQMAKLKQGIKDMAAEIPASTTEISAVAEAAGQLGIQTDNVLAFTKTMINMGNATNLSADEAATTLARFANVTKMSQSDFDRLGSVIVALGNNFATTEAEISAMGMNLASAGTQVGMSQSQIMALATALSSVGLEAQAGGTAFSKVMVNMQLAVEKGGNELKDFASVAGMTTKEFKKAFKDDATTAIMKFVDGLSKSGEQGKSAIKILDDMGVTETRLRDALLRSANASNIMSDAIDLGNKAWEENTALTNEANKRYQTLDSRLEKTKNKIKNVATNTGDKLTPTFNDLLNKVDKLIDKFDGLNEEEVKNIIKTAGMVAAIGPAIKILGTLGKSVGTVTKGVGTLSQAIGVAKNNATSSVKVVNTLATAMKLMSSPTVAITTATVALTAALIACKAAAMKEKASLGGLKKEAENQIKTWKELKTVREESLKSSELEINATQKLADELREITDENGKVKEGYENRAKYILNELNNALGTEYTMNDNIIDQYEELRNNIDNLIATKKAEAALNAYKTEYEAALKGESDATETLVKLKEKLVEVTKTLGKGTYEEQMEAKALYSSISKQIGEQTELISQYGYTIENYNNLTEASVSNSAEAIDEAITQMGISWDRAKESANTSINEQINTQSVYVKYLRESLNEAKEANDTYQEEILKKQLETEEKQLTELAKSLAEQTSTIEGATDEQIEAWKSIANQSYDAYEEGLSLLPEETSKEIMEATGMFVINGKDMKDASGNTASEATGLFKDKLNLEGVTQEALDNTSNIITTDNSVSEATKDLADEANSGFNDNVDGAKWGSDLVSNIVSALISPSSLGAVGGAAAKIGQKIAEYLHHSTPDKGPLKDDDEWMPDFIDSMVYGIYSNKNKVIKSAEDLANDLYQTLNGNPSIPTVKDFGKLQSSLSNQIIDSTKTVFTTPQIVFNVQELDEAKLQQCFNYVNRKFGSQY